MGDDAARPGGRRSGPSAAQFAVLDASPNPIVAVDSSARISYVNSQVSASFGYAAEELLGQSIEVLLPLSVRERHVAHRDGFLRHPIARPMGIGLDLSGRRKDGTEFPVEVSLSAVESAGGLRVFATVVDITARKAAEAQLLQAQKLESIGRLAGGIAHDFNNMLFAIRGFAELLEEDLAPEHRATFDPAAALHSVQAISNAANRASILTGQLLAFSRQQVISPTVLDINAALRSVEPMIRRLVGENIRLSLDMDPATGHIRADSGQLGQIFINLVVNARDAMPTGGTVTIQTSNAVFDEPYALEKFNVKPGAYAMLAVSDTGQGMDRATREHIFEPFFTTKEPGKGTGLGLATIYGIVSQAGGHIWLYSEPGHGSTFKLYFPRVDLPLSESGNLPGITPAVGHGTVLVVEDEPAVREMTTLVLERAGYRVVSVSDGAEALAELASAMTPVDVLLTDVIMPNMSDIELAERVMRDRPGIAIVLASGYLAETLDLDRMIARGAVFAAKPASSTALLEAVQRALAERRDAGRLAK